MLEIISDFLNQGLSYVVPLVVLLGLLISIHELGHFLVARFFGIRVEVFSIGFGPKILTWVRGGTTYCISLLPFGGYVKMYGDVPGESIPEKEIHLSYLHKPVGQRICVVLAGPLMNLFFASFLFYCVAQMGDETASPVVGDIALSSKAYQAGFRPLDRVLKINDTPIERWEQVRSLVEDAARGPLTFEVVQPQGEPRTVEVTPQEIPNKSLFSIKDKIGFIEGFHNKIHRPLVGVKKGPFYSMGLRSGDTLLQINGQDVEWYKDIAPMISKNLNQGVPTLSFKVRRYTHWGPQPSFEDRDMQAPSSHFKKAPWGLFVPETVLAHVQEKTPAAQAGLLMGDQIQTINGKPIRSFPDIIDNISSYSQGEKPLKVEVLRKGVLKTFSITPEIREIEEEAGQEKTSRFAIGVLPFISTAPQSFVWKSTGWSSVSRAFEQTVFWSKLIVLGLIRIVQNKISSKNIGGLISIGQVAQKTWSVGASSFLKMMGVLSINLFILNLLPIPVLDGGHLVLFLLEAIKGSPLSLRKVIIAQQVGLFILLFLMIFALFNDFTRIFDS